MKELEVNRYTSKQVQDRFKTSSLIKHYSCRCLEDAA
jgi:hypothetical protein